MNFLETCLVLSGIFYAVLCVFSIVTGIIYMMGKISIASVLVKLKGKISAFPLIKLVFYVSIMVVLILH